LDQFCFFGNCDEEEEEEEEEVTVLETTKGKEGNGWRLFTPHSSYLQKIPYYT